ncbi:MAG: twin-arginine translocation signal domain-containing protein, partial [Desulfatiglandales bacterium]
MGKKINGPLSRRDFLQMTASLAAAGFATTLTPDLLYAKPKTDLKGVTIDYWLMVQQQNPIVKKLTLSIIKAFEQKTGAKVNVTMEGYASIIGPKYRTQFSAGKTPTCFDAAARWTGQLRSFLRPLNDFIENEWDRQARDGVAWYFPLIKHQNSGFADK